MAGGGYSLLQKTENPGRRGVLSKIPSVVGVWIFSGTTQSVILLFLKVFLKEMQVAKKKEVFFCFINLVNFNLWFNVVALKLIAYYVVKKS